MSESWDDYCPKCGERVVDRPWCGEPIRKPCPMGCDDKPNEES